MQVQAATPGCLQDRARQNAPVSHDESEIGVALAEPTCEFAVANALRLVHGQAKGGGGLLHRGYSHFHSTPCPPIGLADDTDHAGAGMQGPQRGDGELGSAKEDGAESHVADS